MNNTNKIIRVAGDYAMAGVTIDYTTRLDDIFDSLDKISFIVAVEELCHCEIAGEKVDDFVTIADVIAYVNEIKSVAVVGACPVCSTPIDDFTPGEGCWICPNCGYSPCAL